jgi:hypothetical protein
VKVEAVSIEGLLSAARSKHQKYYFEVNMTAVTDTDIREIKTAIEASTKAIADLTLEMRVGFASVDTKFAVLREEMQVGLANIDTKFAKLEGKVDTVEAKLEGKIDQLDERTRLGFWGFIFRGTALAALAALTAIFVKYLFPILPQTLPRL